MRRRLRTPFVCFFCAGLVLATSRGTAAFADATRWSTAVPLNRPGNFGWFPEVATDAAGGVHVFWSQGYAGLGGYDAVTYCQPHADGCSEWLDIAMRPVAGGSFLTRPAAAVDAEGMIHLLWRRKSIICYMAASARGPRTLPHWSRPRKLGEPGYYSTIAIDNQGTLHAAWSQGVFNQGADCRGCADIFYSRSTDQGYIWSPPTNVSRTDWGSEKPQLAFGRDDTVYLAWEEGRDVGAGKGEPQSSMLAVSEDGGRTWERRATFEQAGDAPQSIAVGVDGDGRVVVVWQQIRGERIFYQLSDDRGRSWSEPRHMVGLRTRWRRDYNKLDDYDMAADPAGHLHLVLAGRSASATRRATEGNDLDVFHVEWDGTKWLPAQSIFTTAGAPEWPRIAVANGNQLHAVWFERPAGYEWNTEEGQYRVWYARGETAAPALTPVVWPTPAPPSLSADEIGRIAQLVAALVIFAAIVIVSRRLGW